MEHSIRKRGNIATVSLPAELLGLLRAARPVYSLAELVEQCDTSVAEPADMADWHNIIPVGCEA
jgi:antitoxin ChpS